MFTPFSLGWHIILFCLLRATATGTHDLSHICDLHHSPRQRWTLTPPHNARDRTHILMVPSQIRFRCAMTGILALYFILFFIYYYYFFVFLPFLGPLLRHMADSTLAIELEL